MHTVYDGYPETCFINWKMLLTIIYFYNSFTKYIEDQKYFHTKKKQTQFNHKYMYIHK